MAMQYWMTDGNKSIALSQYPPESWTILSGKSEQEQDADEAISKARARVGILHRCLDIRRNAITRIPWEISRGDTVLWSSEDAECPPELEWMELLPTQYLADIELMLCLCNQAYMLKERNRAKMLGLKWLAKSTMTPIWDETNGLVGFERRLSATNKKRFEPDDILYIWRRNPEHETEPDVSPAQAALSAANVVYGLDEFVKGYFNRGGVKLTLFGVPESTSTTERDRFNSVLKRMFRGVRSAWSTFVFNADQINPVTIGEGIGELHNDQLMNNRQNALVTTMGVPHSKLFSNAANYATAQQDDMAFYADTLIPDAVMIARQVNRQLLRPLGLAWTFHPEQMSVFQEDEEQRSVALLNYVQAGYPLSVASEMLGLHLPRGMEYSELDAVELEPGEPEPTIVQPVPTQPALPPPADNTAEAKAAEIRRFKAWAGKRKHPDPAKFESAILSEDEKAALLAEVGITANFFESKNGQSTRKDAMPLDPDDPEAELDARMDAERQAENGIARGLREQERAVISAVQGEGTLSAVEDALRENKETATDALRRALIASVDLGVNVAISQLAGIGFDWTLANDDARRWAEQYTGQLIAGIDRTTAERTRRAVSAWIDNGEPLARLREELAPIFGRQRAELIASTEVTRAYAEGNRQAYRASGVVQRVEWRTAVDERVCPVCGPLDGKTDTLDGNFGGVGFPPAHPRCRCWIVPVVEDVQRQEFATTAIEITPDFPTQREYAQYLTDKHGVTVDFGKLDLDTVQEISRSVDYHFSRFPELSNRVKFIGSAQARNTAVKEHFRPEVEKRIRRLYLNFPEDEIQRAISRNLNRYVTKVDGRTYAMAYNIDNSGAYSDFSGIVVNEKFGKKSGDMVSGLKRDIASSFHPIGTDSIRAVIDHELGHQIDFSFDLSQNPDLLSILEQVRRMDGGVVNNLSRYATTNTREFIAEGWSEYLNNPNPREAARMIGEFMEGFAN